MRKLKWILATIVLAQLCCTSLWFAGNAVMADLIRHFNLDQSALGHLTSAVQLGFIVGTLGFALLSVADRYSPSRVFFISSLCCALLNLGVIWQNNSLLSLLVFRFGTGVFLAGIYPVGMKIAADYFKQGLGKSLGYLVGALVVGTALPHLLRDLSVDLSWETVIFGTSGLACLGGLMMNSLVSDGPYREAGPRLDFSAAFRLFRNRPLRQAALGYFGHMWELYSFWAFVPIMLLSYHHLHPGTGFNIARLSFVIIALGGLACVLGGYLSQWLGTRRTAFLALLLSACCCLIAPLFFALPTVSLFLAFLMFWGMVVIADSPLFSTLVAQHASPQIRGTALTIVNSIGFAITIASIQLMTALWQLTSSPAIYTLLALGPIGGLIALQGKHPQKLPGGMPVDP